MEKVILYLIDAQELLIEAIREEASGEKTNALEKAKNTINVIEQAIEKAKQEVNVVKIGSIKIKSIGQFDLYEFEDKTIQMFDNAIGDWYKDYNGNCIKYYSIESASKSACFLSD